MKNNDKIKLIEGGLVGVALGIAAGMMLAPKSGKELRANIKDKYVEFNEYLKKQFKKIKETGEDGLDAFIDGAMKTYKKSKELSETEKRDLISHAKKSWNNIKKTFSKESI